MGYLVPPRSLGKVEIKITQAERASIATPMEKEATARLATDPWRVSSNFSS